MKNKLFIFLMWVFTLGHWYAGIFSNILDELTGNETFSWILLVVAYTAYSSFVTTFNSWSDKNEK